MTSQRSRGRKLRVCVVTGTRAEFGLLAPIMRAVKHHPGLALQVVAGGAHLLPPARTIREVEAEFRVHARLPMQRPGQIGRLADAASFGRGASACASAFADLQPDWVVVLGDRIEAFAAASAASIAGIAVCHVHGGDRAEGIADEAMRHAITKLSHLHCAATSTSAARIARMGEDAHRIHITGSPAIDGLSSMPALPGRTLAELGHPRAVVLLHPSGVSPRDEALWALQSLIRAQIVVRADDPQPEATMFNNILLLEPNSDPGRERISEVWNFATHFGATLATHLPRSAFVGLLKSLKAARGVLIGNSSAGLIEAAAIGLPVVNLGPRQAGRERAGRVLDVPGLHDGLPMTQALARLLATRGRIQHPYGSGRAGPKIAALLARTDPYAPNLLRKRNAY